MSLDRRDFLKLAGVQAGALLALPHTQAEAESAAPAILSNAPEVVVIGAGAFGGWTAFNLRRMGASVTLVDMYGPGNSRATSGDETRGIRSSYGANETWVLMAKEAIKRWKQWDEEFAKPLKQEMFFTTGDIILRASEDGMIRNSRTTWDKHGFKSETLNQAELRYRFPQINVETFTVGLLEPDAGVARARRSTQVIAEQFQKLGGRITIGRASLGKNSGRTLDNIALEPGTAVTGAVFVFACGPWLPKVFPDVMGPRMRTPMGTVQYFGTPPGDLRFTHPHMPSWNVPGVTGWGPLPIDSRGFRVRGGGGGGGRQSFDNDPDLSTRWYDARESGRSVLQQYFPDLARQPLLETRACHYEGGNGGNFLVDKHPDFDNVWIAGCGNSEGFKMGPVLGEYIAKRVLAKPTDPKLDTAFKLTTQVYAAPPSFNEVMRARRAGRGEP